MESEIRFLRDLGHDLERAAAREPVRARKARTRSMRWVPAVAAVLVVAWGIGTVVQNPGALNVVSDDGGADAAGAPSASELPDAVPGVAEERGQAGDEPESGRDDAFDGFGTGYTSADGVAANSVGGEARSTTSLEDLSKVIRTGRMRVEVDDGTFREARDLAVTIAEDSGGFVLDSRVEGRSGTFTLRVPAARFDGVMTKLGRLGTVELEEQNGEDVTAEYVDLQARIQILAARRDVILRLSQQATGLSQSLLLANTFDEVQLELERYEGQLRFLKDQVAESTIKLEIVERSAPEQRQEQVDNPSLLEAWKRGIQGFMNVLAVAIIGLGYLLPLLIAVAAWFGIRELMRRRRRA